MSSSKTAATSKPLTLKGEEPEEIKDRVIIAGRPDHGKVDNSISTSKYTAWTFLPLGIREQFRRLANVYFLVIGIIMFIGAYTPLWDSAISPWSTIGPLVFVVSVSMIQEGFADAKRHRADAQTNNAPCTVLRRADDLDREAKHHGRDRGERNSLICDGEDLKVSLKRTYFAGTIKGATPQNKEMDPVEKDGDSVKIAFESILRKDIRSGHFVMVRNREMIPADLVVLASSSENGSAYIETSSIDGETNLKLRTSPHLPKDVLKKIRRASIGNNNPNGEGEQIPVDTPIITETVDQAVKRLTRFSVLGYPEAAPATENPNNDYEQPDDDDDSDDGKARSGLGKLTRNTSKKVVHLGKGSISKLQTAVSNNLLHSRGLHIDAEEEEVDAHNFPVYATSLRSEPPNASVNTYTGTLTLPPVEPNGPSIAVPLNADNMVLRGAMLRNTDWVIGLAVFTGTDTKIIQNSFDTPSKFSRVEQLMNKMVILILCIMVICIISLAAFGVTTQQVKFPEIWYTGRSVTGTEQWPYLPENFYPIEWKTEPQHFFQFFFLYITLLSNFIPLSMYVSIEIVTYFLMYLLNTDKDMYHEDTDTPAQARSTTLTDLGQVQYVFSDKTGTLTQNVMKFKRCSVDGMVFGTPLEKFRPQDDDDNASEPTPFHPLRQLLVGRVTIGENEGEKKVLPPGRQGSLGLDQLGGSTTLDEPMDVAPSPKAMTFNAEMFCRCMSICHTVVVENEYTPELGQTLDVEDTNSMSLSATFNKFFGRKPTGYDSQIGKVFGGALSKVVEEKEGDVSREDDEDEEGGVEKGPTFDPKNGSSHGPRVRLDTGVSELTTGGSEDHYEEELESMQPVGKGPDGAPKGYMYQAESPDEGALVSAASSVFDYQVDGRDSSGVSLSVVSPSLLEDERIVNGLKNGSLTPKALAAETSDITLSGDETEKLSDILEGGYARKETWAILAINKFDSERKRMSVLVRSPPELGSIPILFCKGADSSMLDPDVCEGADFLMTGEETPTDVLQKSFDIERKSSDEHTPMGKPSFSDDDNDGETKQEDWEMAGMLGMQIHLSEFAKEGLRTLVLGLRVLSEEECSLWLRTYHEASTSIKNRSEKLKAAAFEIERKLHIVGATAIEDKLQDGVPQTISTLGNAGIKLWVLTGDKRETAIEIGYSTHVLTEKMHLSVFSDGPADIVRTQMAMEFIRLIKMGKLPEYQRATLEKGKRDQTWEDRMFHFALYRRRLQRSFRRFWLRLFSFCLVHAKRRLEKVDCEEERDSLKMSPTERHCAVRERADQIIENYLKSPEGQAERMGRTAVGPADDKSLASEEVPEIFRRASSAKAVLEMQKEKGRMSQSEERNISIAQLTAQQLEVGEAPLVEEDLLSMESFIGGGKNDTSSPYDGKKRTVLEKMFATDRDTRRGRLTKHIKKEKLQSISEVHEARQTDDAIGELSMHSNAPSTTAPRALVIEGHALLHILGDPLVEEMLFGVASNCDGVIACRVSPKQKALVVKLVRKNVSPEPVTLAIGDGANDVGMIQEAHVGIGISGLEGQQAVNASDFAIAQFRFLETLLLIHGRWNFHRMATVVLFFFYKNAVMAGCLIVYSAQTAYSGTTLFDQWVIAVLNFVATLPIIFTGWFDRCLEKDYVRAHPEVYAPGRNNELMTYRVFFRWIFLVFVHIFTLYYFTILSYAGGGGITPAFQGLMNSGKPTVVGDGEGGDLQSVGTIIFSNLILLLTYKVLYESRSIIHGRWPAFSCKKGDDSFINRIAWTWHGLLWGQVGFYLFFLYVYEILGYMGPGQFSDFVMVTYHILQTRSTTWMIFILVPTAAIVFDVIGKLFGNMFYPTQTQIHLEIAAKEKAARNRNKREANAYPGSTNNRPPEDSFEA